MALLQQNYDKQSEQISVFRASIVEADVPDSITSIPFEQFMMFRRLTKVTLPETLESLGCSAFRYCSSLKSIIFKSMTPPSKNLPFPEAGEWGNSATVSVPKGCTVNYVYKGIGPFSKQTEIKEIPEY